MWLQYDALLAKRPFEQTYGQVVAGKQASATAGQV
jgi:hypothetical protein